jgi:hypothetical protein
VISAFHELKEKNSAKVKIILTKNPNEVQYKFCDRLRLQTTFYKQVEHAKVFSNHIVKKYDKEFLQATLQ